MRATIAMLRTSRDEAVRKTFREGTDRIISPEQTLARLLPALPEFGITRIANLTGLDHTGIPVVMVCRPNARSSAVFHGKGLDLAAAKASGVMEAIETWHAEHVQLPLRLQTPARLHQAANVAEVESLPMTVASRFHPDLPILWVEGEELISGDTVWVPYEAVHMDGTLPPYPGQGCFAASTNGLASGNHRLEAVSHGLCEVIERDATTLWRHRTPSEKNTTRLDLATVEDDRCLLLLDRLQAAGLEIAVWNVTTDVGVPAFQCLLLDRTGAVPHIGQGSGCHPAANIALCRALTEAAQVRTTYIVGSREDIHHSDYDQSTLDQRARSARQLTQSGPGAQDFQSLPTFDFQDLKTEVTWLVDRLRAAGLPQAVIVDLTDSRFEIPVVRVLIPGLEGSDHLPDYAPGARARRVRQAS